MLEKIQLAITIVLGVGMFAGSLAFVVDKFFSRKKKEDVEELSSANGIAKFWKEQAEQYKAVADEKEKSYASKLELLTKDFNDKYTDLKEKFGKLQGQYEAEKGARERAESILKDRNPETQKFMEAMLKSAKDTSEHNEKAAVILEDIFRMCKAEHERDFKVEATVTKT